ncbi:Hypothetical_protein [Hexamita inflata]|uniref:Hypothetical_protein n=1 Tax=Hexamita inflata TaxID=28002 RepID=A0AA86NXD2_9EUKA|nr:Hypothetical protein HINF_LOCUS15403 [Hexamita inflata]
MFKYNITGNALRMSSSHDKHNDEPNCSNDLKLFEGMKLLKVSIDGQHNIQSRLEFVLKSHQTDIKYIEIENCIIDLSKAQGQFEDLKFTNCIFTGSLTDKLSASLVTVNSTGIALSQLQYGSITSINVSREYNSQNKQYNLLSFDFSFHGALDMTNLKNIVLNSITIDLSSIFGNWQSVTFTDCTFTNQLTDNFSTVNCEISSRTQDFLANFKNYRFNNLAISIRSNRRAYFTISALKCVKWQYINLTLYNFNVYLIEFTGNFSELTFDYCTLTHIGVKSLNVQKLSLIKCGYRFSKRGSDLFRNTFCDVLNVIEAKRLSCIPSTPELNVQSSIISLKQPNNQLQRINLTGHNQILSLNVTRMNNLSSFTTEKTKNKKINELVRFVQSRNEFKMKNIIDGKKIKQLLEMQKDLKQNIQQFKEAVKCYQFRFGTE